MNVSMTCLLGKVNDNSYKGLLQIGEGIFVYALDVLPDNEVKKRGLKVGAGVIKDDRAALQVTLKKDKISLDLGDDEYDFFSATICSFVYDYMKDPDIRENKGIDKKLHLQQVVKYEGLEKLNNISYMPRNIISLCPRECRLLNRPKFGCALKVRLNRRRK